MFKLDNLGSLNIEFIIATIVLLLFVSSIVGLVVEDVDVISQTQTRKDARLLVDNIALILNDLNIQPNVYKTHYKLPDKINNESYIIKINSTEVVVNEHYQLTSQYLHKIQLNQENYILLPSNTYVFIKNNNKIHIIQK